jgi:hypothetical protein
MESETEVRGLFSAVLKERENKLNQTKHSNNELQSSKWLQAIVTEKA